MPQQSKTSTEISKPRPTRTRLDISSYLDRRVRRKTKAGDRRAVEARRRTTTPESVLCLTSLYRTLRSHYEPTRRNTLGASAILKQIEMAWDRGYRAPVKKNSKPRIGSPPVRMGGKPMEKEMRRRLAAQEAEIHNVEAMAAA